MGTPDFAVESLRALVEGGYNVVAVITMPDKPAGRGHKLQFSPVKQYALSVGLPVLQPEKLKDATFLEELRSYHADLQIVVAFRMLPEVVWAMPRLGTFNLHASLLPKYRGAAPVNWAVINGEKETGATTFFIRHEIDTGDMILQRRIPIADEEDAGSVHDRLMLMGAQMVCETVDLIAAGDVHPTPQPVLPEEEMLPAPKIFRETCILDFSKTALQVCNFVRGLSPYPGAWCTLEIGTEAEVIKVFSARPTAIQRDPATDVGKPVIDYLNRTILIACRDYYIQLYEMQRPGKKRMTVKDALNGYHLNEA